MISFLVKGLAISFLIIATVLCFLVDKEDKELGEVRDISIILFAIGFIVSIIAIVLWVIRIQRSSISIFNHSDISKKLYMQVSVSPDSFRA